MLQFDLSADIRNDFGKGAARRMRREGLAPAIIYGPKTDALALKLDAKILTKTLITLQRRNALFSLDINDGGKTQKRHVVVKEVQAAPVSGDLVHADFLEVKLEDKMVFDVDIKYTGTAKGVVLGGDLHVSLSKVKLKGVILDIPDFLELDITPLNLGDRINCSDLQIPAGVELLNDLEDACVSVITAAKVVPEEGDDEAEVEEESAAEGDSQE